MTHERQAMVSLLRSPGMVFYDGGSDKCALLRTVAAQIEADGKRIAELEAALKRISQIGERNNNDYTVCPDCMDMETTARAALAGDSHDQ